MCCGLNRTRCRIQGGKGEVINSVDELLKVGIENIWYNPWIRVFCSNSC